MIFNNFGENFYVRGPGEAALNAFILIVSPWFMPLMFALAGISTAYALERRTSKQYAAERLTKLFIPFAAGLLLLIPVQTYFAERFHNGYTGGYFQQYILFFTKPTDLSGYTGGFTPGHLWFILYLFVISLVMLPIIQWYRKGRHKLPTDRMTVPLLLPMFILTSLLSLVLNLGGKSVGYFLGYFSLGFFILSADAIQRKLEKNRWLLLAAFVALTAVKYIFREDITRYSDILYGLFHDFVAWLGILSLLGLGKRYLEVGNKVTRYFAEGSFPIYIFHQTVLVAAAFYVFRLTSSVPLQVACIIVLTFIVTVAVYELFRRLPPTRFLFGIKKPAPREKTPPPTA
jgi:hypothetical protein